MLKVASNTTVIINLVYFVAKISWMLRPHIEWYFPLIHAVTTKPVFSQRSKLILNPSEDIKKYKQGEARNAFWILKQRESILTWAKKGSWSDQNNGGEKLHWKNKPPSMDTWIYQDIDSHSTQDSKLHEQDDMDLLANAQSTNGKSMLWNLNKISTINKRKHGLTKQVTDQWSWISNAFYHLVL